MPNCHGTGRGSVLERPFWASLNVAGYLGIGARLSTVLALVWPVEAVVLQVIRDILLRHLCDFVVGVSARIGTGDWSKCTHGGVLPQRIHSALPQATSIHIVTLDSQIQNLSLTWKCIN